MSARKRIAVMIAQPNAPYQKSMLQGIIEEAFKYDMDVLVFSSFVKTAEVLYLRGEQTIYELVNYELVDAVLVVPDTIKIPGVTEQIIEELKRHFTGPVLVLDWESKDFPAICNDDTSDVQKMIDHLIDVHHYNRIFFMTGPKDHLCSKWRTEGYTRSLEAHHIPIDEEMIYYGDFWIQEAENVAKKVLSMNPRPQAIACASEEMALSAYNALLKCNVRIPEDIALVGYDPLGSALHSNFMITMMPRASKKLGIRAVRAVVTQLLHIQIQDDLYPSELLLQGSCGCISQKKQEPLFWSDTSMTESHDYNDILTSFFSVYNFMLEDIIAPEKLIDSLYKVMDYTWYIKGFTTFHICLNQDWIDRNINSADFTEEMLYVLNIKDDAPTENKVSLDRKFPREDMLPMLDEDRKDPSVFYFTPLHFNGINFGYSVIVYENKCEVFPRCYSQWSRKLNNGLESQRRQCRLQKMYNLMRENAVKDLLTNVYSRNGFNIYGTKLFEEAKREKLNLLVIVGDINDTKIVNDTYGHMEGDAAIKMVADSFASQLDKKHEHGKVFRIGGDEFVLMIIGEYTDEQISAKIQGILDTTNKLIVKNHKPYELSASLGAYYGPIRQQDEMNKIISLADGKMYERKSVHRRDSSIERS